MNRNDWDEIIHITHSEIGSMWDTVREECAKEREACAKVADDEDDRRHGIANNISIIIRARGNE